MRGGQPARVLVAARPLVAAVVLLAAQAAAGGPLEAQQRRLPLAPILPSGDEVAPFFEGWYRNDDGTFTLSFGFFNLNSRQILDIPLGPENFIEPAEFDGHAAHPLPRASAPGPGRLPRHGARLVRGR